jgi:hypothetical protein
VGGGIPVAPVLGVGGTGARPWWREHGAIRRTLVFSLSLVALLLVARSNVPTFAVRVFFVLFFVCATVWLRGQYVDDLDGRQWAVPPKVARRVLVLALVLVAVFVFVLRRGGWGLLGLLLAYLACASLVASWRQSSTACVLRWGIRLTGAGLLLAGAGFAALGRVESVWIRDLVLLTIAAAVLLLLPLGLAFLSEVAMSAMAGAPGGVGQVNGGRAPTLLQLKVGLGGLAMFCLARPLPAAVGSSAWLVGVTVVLGLFTLALVSGTSADIVVVMALVALMGITPRQVRAPEPVLSATGRDVMVALGDSYLSGEGASQYYRGTDEGGGNQCRRSPTAWAAMAVDQLGQYKWLEFLACSGATTANLLSTSSLVTASVTGPVVPPPEHQPGEDGTELDQYLNRHGDAGGTQAFVPGLVVLSIGGNDAGFSTIGLMCLAPGNCDTRRQMWTSTLGQVRARLRLTYQEVSAVFPRTPVVVVPYPDPIYRNPTPDPRGSNPKCTQLALTDAEQDFVHTFVTGEGEAAGLNETIRETAAEFGFYYLAEMEDALATSHLQLCDPLNEGRPGVNFIGLRSVNGIAEQRFNPLNWAHSSLHPNERGHAAMLRTFEVWRGEQPDVMPVRLPVHAAAAQVRDRARRAVTPAQAARTASVQAPPCDLFDVSPRGCRPQGTRWAEREVGAMLVSRGWIGLLVVAGAWAFAVALFSWRRRRWNGVDPPPLA